MVWENFQIYGIQIIGKCICQSYMEQSIQEWITWNLWKTAFKKFEVIWSLWSKWYGLCFYILQYFVPYLLHPPGSYHHPHGRGKLLIAPDIEKKRGEHESLKKAKLKGYLRYKIINSQSVPSEAQVKNFFIS